MRWCCRRARASENGRAGEEHVSEAFGFGAGAGASFQESRFGTGLI